MPTLEINDFSKGITDNIVNGDPQSAKRLNNVVINEFGKTVQRDGINIYSTLAPQIPPGNQRIDSLYYFDATLFAKSGTNLYYLEDGAGAWVTLSGPNTTAFADSELGAKVSWSEWRGHLFATPGPSDNIKTGCRTVKMYRNGSGVWTLVQAGMPSVRDQDEGGIQFSEGSGVGFTVFYQYITMFMFVRQYVAMVNGVNTVFKDVGAPEVSSVSLVDKVDSSGGISWESGITYTNQTFENYDVAGFRVETFRTKADQTELLLAANNESSNQDRTADDDLGTIVVGDTAGGTTNNIYFTSSSNRATGRMRVALTHIGFFYVGQFPCNIIDTNTAVSIDLYVTVVNYANGDVTFSATKGGAGFDLSAGGGGGYSTANLAEVSFPYSAALPAGYDAGNYNDRLMPCYFSAVTDSYGWYAAPQEDRTGFHRAVRLQQSKPLDVDATPGANYIEIATDRLAALGLVGQHPIVFNRKEHYRIENRLDAFGNGSLRAVLISDEEGAICQEVLRTKGGIYFISENGWCFTDGFNTINLSQNHLRQTFAALNNRENMSGCVDTKNNRVIWGVESADLVPAITDKNNAAFAMDLQRTEPGRGTFTTMSADANFQPNALHYDSANCRVIIGDQRGYVFVFDADLTTDPVVDTGAAYSTWNRTGIVWDIITVSLGFGTSRLSKWMQSIYFTAKNLWQNLSVDFFVYKDDRITGVRGKVVRDHSNTSGIHKITRMFPKGVLNCIYSMIQFKKGLVNIARSDDYTTATVAGFTAQLSAGTWPLDGVDNLVGHSLYVGPLYTTAYAIAAQSGDTLTLSTAPAAGVYEWVVKGYPKDEGLELHDIHIDHTVIGEGYPDRSDSGANT